MGDWPEPSRACRPSTSRRACEDSLRRLQTDYIDLYQMHHIDRDCPWEEIWQAMERSAAGQGALRRQQQLRRLAHRPGARSREVSAIFSGSSPSRASTISIERTVELEVIPACQAYGLGLIPWSPLAAWSAWRRLESEHRPVGGRIRRSGRTSRPIAQNSKPTNGSVEPSERPGRRRSRLATAPAGRDRPHHRTSHDGTVDQRHAEPGADVNPGDAQGAGRDLPRPRRSLP